jgi:hypothetical protein
MLSISLKLAKHLVFIVSVAYFFAMSFKICIEIQNNKMGWHVNAEDDEDIPDNFESYYNLHGKSKSESGIILVYFMFTTLTTVGFGDYVPKSDFERIIISAGLLFGVSIFSYIMGEFLEMINATDDTTDDAN